MKKYSVNVTNYAYKQLSEISEYISEVLFSPETAKKWLIKMRKEISELSIFPSKFTKLLASLADNFNLCNFSLEWII